MGRLMSNSSQRGLLQIMRNGGHAIGLLDREFGNGQEAAIVSHERDIGAVQGGNERQALGCRHGTREERADRMRNRVVNVEQVQPFRLRHLHHFDSERQRIGGVVEQWIIRDFDFVELDALRGRV